MATAQQELFLEYLFNDKECMRDSKKAAVKAGYEMTSHATLVRSLSGEILERSREELTTASVKAVGKVVDSMDADGSTPKGELRLKAAESVLDRVGISKKQEMEVTLEGGSSPLFFIPAKEL